MYEKKKKQTVLTEIPKVTNNDDNDADEVWLFPPTQKLKDAMKERRAREKRERESASRYQTPNSKEKSTYETEESSDLLRLTGGSLQAEPRSQGQGPFTVKKSSPEQAKFPSSTALPSPYTVKKPQAIRTSSTSASASNVSTRPSTVNGPNGIITSQILMGNNTPPRTSSAYAENNINKEDDDNYNFENASSQTLKQNTYSNRSQVEPPIQQNVQKRKYVDRSDTKQTIDPKSPQTLHSSSSSSTSTSSVTTKRKNAPAKVKGTTKQQKTSPFLLLFAIFMALGLIYVFTPYLTKR